MTKHTIKGGHSEKAMQEKAGARFKDVFLNMPHEVSLVLITDSVRNEPYNRAAREVIHAIRKMTPKILLREYDLDHEMAKTWNVTVSPTLLFNPDHYAIRWLGAPVGEEARTFAEALIMMGYGETGISEDSRKVLDKITEPRQVTVFVSPTCPYCPQQAVNAFKAAIEKPGIISLEIVDVQANPATADRYGAHSVPQVFADDILIAQGAQPEELFMASLEQLEQQTVFIPESDAAEVETDLVIVGGGPAGLTAGIYAVRSGLRAVIIEKGLLGGQVATTPVVENYPGLTHVGGKALVDIMISHALEYTSIFPGEDVMDIIPGTPTEVITSRRRFTTQAVLLATGAVYRHLGIEGESRLAGHGISYCSTCDGPLFTGKKVIVAGGGNSAVTEALHLHHIGVDVTLVHRRDTLRAQEQLIQNLHDNNIPILFNTEIRKIRGEKVVAAVELYNNKTDETTTMNVNGVFIAIGYEPSVELAKKLGVELTTDGYINHDGRHRTSVPGIYSAGDVEGGYKQIVIAAAKGSEAALAIYEDLMNPYWKI
ncbi:MAG TPA: pyridine nucleotide-disulfide oxidoreductase [Deltaproteobacteria bacterium]|nr:pyridine nucleotide-disulfide oxidoreductase [Deltaproteobacteria bacterium]